MSIRVIKSIQHAKYEDSLAYAIGSRCALTIVREEQRGLGQDDR